MGIWADDGAIKMERGGERIGFSSWDLELLVGIAGEGGKMES